MNILSIFEDVESIRILEDSKQASLKGGAKGQGCAPSSFDDDDDDDD